MLRRLAGHRPLGSAVGIKLELAPSGLFSDAGAKPMDDRFATYARSNDQRIAHLTGERFRMDRTGEVMREVGARGVLAVIVSAGAELWMLDLSALYGDHDTLAAQLGVAGGIGDETGF